MVREAVKIKQTVVQISHPNYAGSYIFVLMTNIPRKTSQSLNCPLSNRQGAVHFIPSTGLLLI